MLRGTLCNLGFSYIFCRGNICSVILTCEKSVSSLRRFAQSLIQNKLNLFLFPNSRRQFFSEILLQYFSPVINFCFLQIRVGRQRICKVCDIHFFNEISTNKFMHARKNSYQIRNIIEPEYLFVCSFFSLFQYSIFLCSGSKNLLIRHRPFTTRSFT